MFKLLWKFTLSIFKKKIARLIMMSTLFFIMRILCIKEIELTYNPEILKIKKSIVVSNHINNLDWFIIYISLNVLKKNNIIYNAKKSLRFITKLIRKLKIANFIFLNRKLNYDLITLITACNTIKQHPEFHVVLFPEGTLITNKKSASINEQRIKRRNLNIITKNVMIPKTSGFMILLKELQINYIINSTLSYDFDNKKVLISLDVVKAPFENKDKWLINLFLQKEKGLNQINNGLKINLTTFNVIESFIG
nr:MAG: acetyltransferase [Diabrotica toursvirus 3a]